VFAMQTKYEELESSWEYIWRTWLYNSLCNFI